MSKIGYLIILLIIGFLIYIKFPRKVTKTINQQLGNQNFTLEIADNSFLHAKGLSSRSKLCDNCGMIFMFDEDKTQTFWMKDTLIPLDIIFINSNGLITDIYTAIPQPGVSDFQLTLYKSSLPAKFVIELNANISQKINLKKGDYLNLNL